jgi:methionyl-tRNA formyltransferase
VEGVSYAHKIDKAEARIDWTRTATEIDRQIRGLSPFPGAWTLINGIRVKLLLSQPVAGSGLPGQVLDGTDIACGTGAVRLLRLQREGKAPMDAGDFLRGTRLVRGDVLGAGGGG